MRLTLTTRVAYVLGGALLVTFSNLATADAQPAPPNMAPPMAAATPLGFHAHEGFILRLTPGLGRAVALYSDESRILGWGVSGNLVLGGNVGHRLAVIVESATTLVIGAGVDGLGTIDDLTFSANYVGAGVVRYWTSNLYVQTTIGPSWFTLSSGSESRSSDVGLGARFVIGKEWWVSDNWGLGLAAHLLLGAVHDPIVDDDVQLISFGLHFSATYD